jgi:hypothetical protein
MHPGGTESQRYSVDRLTDPRVAEPQRYSVDRPVATDRPVERSSR